MQKIYLSVECIRFCPKTPFQKQPFADVLENMFLKISQYSQEKTCVVVSFYKVAGIQACNVIKKRLQRRCFPTTIAKFLRTALFMEHDWWLLLLFNKTKMIRKVSKTNFWDCRSIYIKAEWSRSKGVSQQILALVETSWRYLENVFRLRFCIIFWICLFNRRLDQNEYLQKYSSS